MSLRISMAGDWYKSYLLESEGISRAELLMQVRWVGEFCSYVSRRNDIEFVTVRDVVCYFAEYTDSFDNGYEWYARYKAIEAFCDALVVAGRLPSNHLRGVYDDADVEPCNGNQAELTIPAVPVNWSRVETIY